MPFNKGRRGASWLRVCVGLAGVFGRTTLVHKQCELMSVDVEIRNGAAHARVYSTRPRLDFGPIPVEATDDIVVVAIKVPETA